MSTQQRPILLVEDDAGDAELTRWAFQNSNITRPMVVAADGLEALELLVPSSDLPPLNPAIVLMDIDMPRMGGMETVRRIRAEPSIRILPIIMLTCSLADRDILESSDVGANSYVQKPLTISDFLNVASVLGTFWLDMHRTQGTPGRPGHLPPALHPPNSADLTNSTRPQNPGTDD